MAYEHKEGQGSLFKNEKQNDRQPDYKGTIVIGGTTYEIAAWEKTSQRGSKFLSLQAQLPREHNEQKQVYQSPAPEPIRESYQEDLPVYDNEDLPF